MTDKKPEGTLVIALELSAKRKNKVIYRIRPSDCPLKIKYCLKRSTDLTSQEKIEFKCPFLEETGLGNEEGNLIIKCTCSKENSLIYILEEDD